MFNEITTLLLREMKENITNQLQCNDFALLNETDLTEKSVERLEKLSKSLEKVLINIDALAEALIEITNNERRHD